MKKIIFFDIWWTLMDTDNDLFDEVLNKLNLEKNEHSNKKTDFFKNYNFLKNQCKVDDFKTTKELLDTSFKNIFPNSKILPSEIYENIYLNKSFLLKGVIETLEYFKNKWYKLIVVSDADHEILIPQLELLWINLYFEEIIISSQVKWYKPTEPIVLEIEKYIKTTDKLYFIWDLEVDIQTAKKISAVSILINKKWKYLDFNQDFSIRQISEIINIIQ